jgi:hypothetical protein
MNKFQLAEEMQVNDRKDRQINTQKDETILE